MRRVVIIFVIAIAVASMIIPAYEGNEEIQRALPPLIPLLIAGLSAGAQLIGQAASNNQAGKARKKYEGELRGRVDDLNDWFNTEYNRDFLTTDIAQSSIRGLLGQQDRQLDALNNASVAGGATAEANIAAKGKLNENFADAIGRLLGYGTNYKQGLRQQYDYRLQSLYQPIDQLNMAKVNDWSNFQSNITNAGNSVGLAAGMIDWEELLKKKPSGNYAAGQDWGMGEGFSTGT